MVLVCVVSTRSPAFKQNPIFVAVDGGWISVVRIDIVHTAVPWSDRGGTSITVSTETRQHVFFTYLCWIPDSFALSPPKKLADRLA
jgi:hypothetical protein